MDIKMDMYREIMEQPRVLGGILPKNEAVLNSLVAKIKESDIKQVVLAARGSSDHCAIYAKYLIELLVGIPVSLSAASVVTLYGGELRYENTLVLAISQSGAAEDVAAVVKNGNRSKAVTAAITNKEGSLLDKEAAYGLLCAAGEEKSVAATKTFMASLYLVALLVAKWAGNSDLLKSLEALPNALVHEAAQVDSIMALAREYTFMRECITLSRGLLYPLALEAGLKMMETTYTNARGFAVSDFQHGPLALVQQDTPVFLYAPGTGAAHKDAVAAFEQYAALGADLTVFTSDEALAKKARRAVITAKADEYTEIFHHTMAAQLFACGLAIAKHKNPDAPRNIKKVTITK
ncbi:MAG TPA: glutamine--fructose-6-phosphate aminotransferase [Clostridiales bacterium]|nr:glutamine--fructose-6-phosphate aminotransferase [Clostridiales bacterium]